MIENWLLLWIGLVSVGLASVEVVRFGEIPLEQFTYLAFASFICVHFAEQTYLGLGCYSQPTYACFSSTCFIHFVLIRPYMLCDCLELLTLPLPHMDFTLSYLLTLFSHHM